MNSVILFIYLQVRGPEDTPYQGGFYHGKLVFPREFPFRPPSIYMITPSGRFKCNQRLCLSISDFHPDTWNPAWSVTTILTGLLSFMVEDTPTLGSIETPLYTKRTYANTSLTFNLRDDIFCELFPDIVKEIKEKIPHLSNKESESSGDNGPNSQTDTAGRRHDDEDADRGGFSSLFIILGVAAFGLVVNNILRTLN